LSGEAEESHEPSKVGNIDPQIKVKIITVTGTSYKRRNVVKVSGYCTSDHNI
jgi:hypothetical protein